jgi:hypothetical protein
MPGELLMKKLVREVQQEQNGLSQLEPDELSQLLRAGDQIVNEISLYDGQLPLQPGQLLAGGLCSQGEALWINILEVWMQMELEWES